MSRYPLIIIGLGVCLVGGVVIAAGKPTLVNYSGNGSDLQQVIDAAQPGTTIVCDSSRQYEFSTPITIKQTIILKGLNARLPEKLGRTPLIEVKAEGVTLTNLTLHGNHDSVDQKYRASLINIYKGRFLVADCKFYDSSKNGVTVCPEPGSSKDIVGGEIKNIEAFRLGRDAVSISGGNRGLRVRDITVGNVSLKKGYRRGAVEVSDGSDNIKVKNVYAEDCPYAIDVQDHNGKSAPNTNIEISNVTAVNCNNIIRTANSHRNHANLILRNLKGTNCALPVQISHTKNVLVDGLTILEHKNKKSAPIKLKNCHGITFKNVSIDSL